MEKRPRKCGPILRATARVAPVVAALGGGAVQLVGDVADLAVGEVVHIEPGVDAGVDPAFLDDGLAILAGLIIDICGGEASEVIRAGEPPVERRSIIFDFGRTRTLGGPAATGVTDDAGSTRCFHCGPESGS